MGGSGAKNFKLIKMQEKRETSDANMMPSFHHFLTLSIKPRERKPPQMRLDSGGQYAPE
jgi:hypothetical protein